MNECKHHPQYKFCENKAYCTNINRFIETKNKIDDLKRDIKQLEKIEQLILNGGEVRGETEVTIVNKISNLENEKNYLISLRAVIGEQCLKGRD